MVELASTKEGHRTFSAYHPVSFVKKIAGNNKVIEFEEGGFINGKPQQDIWIFQKAGASIYPVPVHVFC